MPTIHGIQIESWERLKPTKDRKTTPLGRDGGVIRRVNGKGRPRGMVPIISNAFGLPAGTSCPGKTEFCTSCYAAVNSEVVFPNVGKAMRHNWEQLADFHERYGIQGYIALLEDVVRRYEKQADYHEIDPVDRIFRIHWDGDFFSSLYSAAWVQVMIDHPNVTFWAYTRSFTSSLNVVPGLSMVPNLSLYLSVDVYNVEEAVEVLEFYPNVGVAACAVDYATARDVLDRARARSPRSLASIICPENAGTLPLINDEGRGACVECLACIRGRRDVLFSTSHVEDHLHGQTVFDFPAGEQPVELRRG